MHEPAFASTTTQHRPIDTAPVTEVLVLSKSFDAPGGVVNFIHSVISNLPARFHTEHLPIGRATRRNHPLSGLLAPIVDNVRLAHRVIRNRFICIHLNPSLNWRSLIRDGAFLLTLSLVGHRRTIVFFHGWSDRVAFRVARNPILRAMFLMTFGRAAMICVLASKFERALADIGVDTRRISLTTTMFDGRIFNGVVRQRRDSALVVLFMARLVSEKGIFETLAAFASVARRFPDATLVVAGDGPELDNVVREAAKRGIGSRVKCTGYLTGHAKAQALLDADLYVFPTYYGEGCPVTLLEAMAAGLPVITNADGGIPDIFADGVNGVLTDGVSVPALATHMTTLLADRTLRVRIGETNRRLAWSRFEASIAVGRIATIYQRLRWQHGHD